MLARQSLARANLVFLKFTVLQFELQVSEPEIRENPRTPSWDFRFYVPANLFWSINFI